MMSDQIDAIQANNAFALALYNQLRAGNATQNLIESPIAANLALTMTYAGAVGTTATQMATALQFGSASNASIFAGQNALSQALGGRAASAYAADLQLAADTGQSAPPESDYQLEVVNSVWGQQGYTWLTPFLNVLAEDYGTGIYVQDFESDPGGADALMNAWVAQETSGNIQNLIPSSDINDLTRLVVIDAIHLELPWQTAFEAYATQPASFTTQNGTMMATVSTPFMNLTNTYPYVDDGTAQIVWLPLANEQVMVAIALPHDDLPTYEAGLTTSSAVLEPPTASALVALSLPKISFTSPTFSLAAALQAMGMSEAFVPYGANFTGMTLGTGGDGGMNPNLYIGDVVEKADIGMAEDGVQASAAVAVVVSSAFTTVQSSTPPPTPVSMVVNRPYFFSVIDAPTGALLFMGHVADPTQTGGG
jgi:serpin B